MDNLPEVSIIDRIIQQASLIGHVVEDLSYENLDPTRFRAKLIGYEKEPVYKQDGFFIFSDLGQGDHKLKITGQRLQPTVIPAPMSAASPLPIFLNSPGDNELIVIVKSTEDVGGNNGEKKIGFDPVILTRDIRAGAPVISDGLPPDSSTRLAATLEAREISSAKVKNGDGIVEGSIVRIIRDTSIRMKFDSYYLFPSPTTRIIGKVVAAQNPAISLAGARVRVTKINDTVVASRDVGGVMIFTGVDMGGKTIVLGAEKDIAVMTNDKGEYHFYFSNETLASFKITDQSLTNLELEGIPGDVRAKLENLKDRIFRGSERFLVAIGETIGGGNVIKYQPPILQHAENFVLSVTLDVSLAGFQSDSKRESINTGQRRVVNFQLAGN